VKAGDTFADSMHDHLWIVISDPAVDSERVVIVNFTKYTTEKEEDCVVKPGEHQFVDKKTLIQFRDAKCCKLADLQTLLTAKLLTPHRAVTAVLLHRIRACASSKSDKLPTECKSSLEDQNLI